MSSSAMMSCALLEKQKKGYIIGFWLHTDALEGTKMADDRKCTNYDLEALVQLLEIPVDFYFIN